MEINLERKNRRHNKNHFGDFLIAGFAILLSVVFYIIFSQLNLVTAYNDAQSHLNMARLVYDNLKPGLAQIGSVWLPLNHILNLVLVWNDAMWRSGFAGSVWSMLSYVLSVYVIYKFILKVVGNKYSAFIGAFLFATNLNILYMQATPMTELTLIFFFTTASYFFYLWAKDKKTPYLIPVAVLVFFATLTRYDGWFLFAFIILTLLFIFYKELRKEAGKGQYAKARASSFLERRLVVFATLAALGIFLWFIWNFVIFGDALYFILGPYSARAQQDWLASLGFLPTDHNLFLSIKAYSLAVVDNAGLILTIFALVGLGLYALRNRIQDSSLALYTLLSPFFFHVISLFLGFSSLFIPGISDEILSHADNPWLNVRYGLMMLPSVALFSSYFTKKSAFLKVTLFVCIILQGFIFYRTEIVTLSDAQTQRTVLNTKDVQNWLLLNAKNNDGLILTSVSYHNALIFSTGLPLRRFIHEGSGKYWEESLIDPAIYAKWIIVSNEDVGDPVYTALYKKQDREFLKYYDVKLKTKDVAVFQRREFAPDFVTKVGSDLLLNYRVFRFVGVNSYDLTYRTPDEIDKTLALAAAKGIRVVRFWAFTDGTPVGFQPNPYEYNDKMFNQLGYIIASAEKKNTKLIVTLSNFWGDYGGVPQYLKWAGAEDGDKSSTDNFYTNQKAQSIYQAYINHVLNYVNPYTQKKLKDEGSIMAWELMNEPRIYDLKREDEILNWINKTSIYIKSIDSTHLISFGMEGFSNSYNDYNNGPIISDVAGTNSSDVLSGHYYLGDNPNRNYKSVMDAWTDAAFKNHRIPLIIGEVGFDKRKEKNAGVRREELLRNFLDYAYKRDANGVILWNWALKIDDSFGVSPLDPGDREYLDIISSYAGKFSQKSK